MIRTVYNKEISSLTYAQHLWPTSRCDAHNAKPTMRWPWWDTMMGWRVGPGSVGGMQSPRLRWPTRPKGIPDELTQWQWVVWSLWVGRCRMVAMGRSPWVGRCGSVAICRSHVGCYGPHCTSAAVGWGRCVSRNGIGRYYLIATEDFTPSITTSTSAW